MSNRIVWVLAAAAVAMVIAGVAFAGRLGSDPTLVDSPLIGEQAPDVDLVGFDVAEPVRISDYAGDVLVVNFWASWCPGCHVEHEALLAASDVYQGSGVTFLGINSQDHPEAARNFLEELGRGQHIEYAVDEDSLAAFAYGVHGMPETFFVDRTGVVVAKVVGPVTYDLLTGTIDSILLAPSATG